MTRLSIANTFLIILLITGIAQNVISIYLTSRVFKQQHYRFGNCLILLSSICYMNCVLLWYLIGGLISTSLEYRLGPGVWMIVTAACLQFLCYLQALYFTRKLQQAEMILRLSDESEQQN